jgi:hypothetical protein
MPKTRLKKNFSVVADHLQALFLGDDDCSSVDGVGLGSLRQLQGGKGAGKPPAGGVCALSQTYAKLSKLSATVQHTGGACEKSDLSKLL